MLSLSSVFIITLSVLTTSKPGIGSHIRQRELIGTAQDEAEADFPGSDFHSFRSRPDIKAPRFIVTTYDKASLAPGYWFVAPYHELQQSTTAKAWVGPYIYDNHGEVVWCGASLFKHYNTFDFKVSVHDGEPMLTLKYPHESTGVIFDNNYRIRQKVIFNKNTKYGIDMHEFNLVDDATHALVVVSTNHYSTIKQAQEIGIVNNQTCRSLWKGFQELDVATSEPLFTWNAHEHLSLTEVTYMPGDYEHMCNSGWWDILHINAVDKFPDGDYLVSMRHTDTLYKISHQDGSIVWRLGGKNSDWGFATEEVKFSRQHHATVRGQNQTHTLVAMFDNAIGTGSSHEKATHKNSRGLLLALDQATKEASVVAQYDHPNGGMTNSRGSFQTLPNGNAFMGWTYHTLLSEHSADGRLLMQAQLKLPGHCYRNYKFQWVGRPTSPPDVYAAASQDGDTVRTMAYASWNGATEVAYWNMLRSDETGEMVEVVATVPRTGFETAMVFDGFTSYVVVEAIDRDGRILGRSLPVKTNLPEGRFDNALIDNIYWLQSQTKVFSAHRIEAIVSNPFFTFICGILVTIVVVFAARLWRRDIKVRTCWDRQHKQHDAQQTASEPLLRRHSEIENGDYTDKEKYEE